MTALSVALTQRFTDTDEIKGIATYGCSGGVSGFIYSTELCEFFDKFEEDIEDVLNMFEVKLESLIEDVNSWTFQEAKEKSVWFVVEAFCQSELDN